MGKKVEYLEVVGEPEENLFSSKNFKEEDNSSVDFDLPPIFDDYDNEEARYCMEFKDLLNFYMVDFQIGGRDISIEESSFQVDSAIKTILGNPNFQSSFLFEGNYKSRIKSYIEAIFYRDSEKEQSFCSFILVPVSRYKLTNSIPGCGNFVFANLVNYDSRLSSEIIATMVKLDTIPMELSGSGITFWVQLYAVCPANAQVGVLSSDFPWECWSIEKVIRVVVEQELIREELRTFGINSSVDFNRPSVFDGYGDDGAGDAVGKEPCHLYNAGQKFEVVAKPITHTIIANKFLVHQFCDLINSQIKLQEQANCCLVVFQADKDAATLESSCLHHLFDKEARDLVSMLVHGGRWGGWHKGILKLRVGNKKMAGVEGGTSLHTVWLLAFVFLFVLLLELFVFDPGGLELQELRSILF